MKTTIESLKEDEIRVLKRIASSLAGIDTSLRMINKHLAEYASKENDVTENSNH